MIFSVVGGLIPFYDEAKVGFIVFLGALSLSLFLSHSPHLSTVRALELTFSKCKGVFNGASVIYPVLEPILLSASKVRESAPACERAE
jgi:peptidoglycan/LPS O-acetylase OafA/YrhL